MSRNSRLKPGHKAIQQYHAALKAYSGQRVEHEGALETAFQRLLADTAKDDQGLDAHPQAAHESRRQKHRPRRHPARRLQPAAAATGRPRTPTTTSTPRSARRSPRAIRCTTRSSRTPAGPSSSRAAARRDRFDLTDPQKLADLLNDFYAYTEPDIEASSRPSRSSRSASRSWPRAGRQDQGGAPEEPRLPGRFRRASSPFARPPSTRTSAATPSMRCWCSTS